MRLPTSAATRAKFGWDWWAWNLLLAATPPTILWYSLSRTRERMRGEVEQLKAAIGEQKHVAEAQKDREAQAQTQVPVVLPETGGMTPEERIARLEAKLAVLEGHMSPTLAQIQAQAQQAQARAEAGRGEGRGGGGKGAEDSSLMSGVRRRVLGQYEDSVLEAFAKLKAAAAAGGAAAGGAGAGAEQKTALPPAAAEGAGSKAAKAPPSAPPPPPATKKD